MLLGDPLPWPCPALLELKPLSWYLLYAPETVLGDTANLIVTASIGVPSWRSWIAYVSLLDRLMSPKFN